jgi:medium-chain acyl-[acyl-carrier-protein] hydrolase
LIEELSTSIIPLLDRPFLVLGHSVGALIGFELVRQLHKLGVGLPIHFIASSFRAPQLPDRGPILHNLLEEELVSELRRLGGTPEVVLRDKPLLAMFLPILRADFSLAETYTYQPGVPLNCPISVFGGVADQRVSSEELLAWKSQTIQKFSSHFLPGDHFYLFKEKNGRAPLTGGKKS